MNGFGAAIGEMMFRWVVLLCVVCLLIGAAGALVIPWLFAHLSIRWI